MIEIESIGKRTQGFPDGTVSYPFMQISFIDGEMRAIKNINVTATRVGGPDSIAEEYCFQAVRLAKEAERDMAYMKYGKSWREHTRDCDFFALPDLDDPGENAIVEKTMKFLEENNFV